MQTHSVIEHLSIYKRMVEKLNAMDIDVRGAIDQLDIIQHKDKQNSTIEVVKLAG